MAGVCSGGVVREEQPDRWTNALRLRARHQVQLHEQIAARIEPPRLAVRLQRCKLPWRPSEEVAVGKHRRIGNHAAVAGHRIFLIHAPRGGRGIDEDVGVVDAAAVRDAAPAPARTSSRMKEQRRQSCETGPCRRTAARTRATPRSGRACRVASQPAAEAAAGDRLARLPARLPGPSAGRRRFRRRSGGVHRRTLRIRARASTAASSAVDRRRDLTGARPDVVVGEQAEGRMPVGVMTARTLLKQNRGDVPRKCRPGRRRPSRRLEARRRRPRKPPPRRAREGTVSRRASRPTR